jgi:hypothetical protein
MMGIERERPVELRIDGFWPSRQVASDCRIWKIEAIVFPMRYV